MPIRVLTPTSAPRLTNLPILAKRLLTQGVKWTLIQDEADPDIPADWMGRWRELGDVTVLRHTVPPGHIPPYTKLNWYLDATPANGEFYHVLCDDDLVPRDFYARLGEPAMPVTLVCMDRGDRQPAGSPHPTGYLYPAEQLARPGTVGIEQLIILDSHMRKFRWREDCDVADGQLIEIIVRRTRGGVRYRNDSLAVWFNYLEPNRYMAGIKREGEP